LGLLIEQKFTVHPVGQGLFYSGILDISNPPTARFSFVYDCGSLDQSAAASEVSSFRQENSGDIDLLVISHFDADHINKVGDLLAGRRKVRRLVLPFMFFSERIFLALRYRLTGGSDDFVTRCIVDPVGALNDNLDADSEILVVKGDNQPIGPTEVIDNELSADNLVRGLVFDFDDGAKKDLGVKLSKSGMLRPHGRMFAVPDSAKGFVHSGNKLQHFMEFLFCRKSFGPSEKRFYEEVSRQFLRDVGITTKDVRQKLDEVVGAITQMKGATLVKRIFARARKKFQSLPVRIENMNTTSLCLLHYNTIHLFKVAGYHAQEIELLQEMGWYGSWPGYIHLRINDALGDIADFSVTRPHRRYDLVPNTLLTSDAMLQDKRSVRELMKKYRNYWKNFWLFQIPHHGSRHNMGAELASRLPHPRLVKFINHGLDYVSKWRHPSGELLEILAEHDQLKNVIPVSQSSKLEFTYWIQRH
jgi:hypothetical protein